VKAEPDDFCPDPALLKTSADPKTIQTYINFDGNFFLCTGRFNDTEITVIMTFMHSENVKMETIFKIRIRSS
jgi:hypothetical protein